MTSINIDEQEPSGSTGQPQEQTGTNGETGAVSQVPSHDENQPAGDGGLNQSPGNTTPPASSPQVNDGATTETRIETNEPIVNQLPTSFPAPSFANPIEEANAPASSEPAIRVFSPPNAGPTNQDLNQHNTNLSTLAPPEISPGSSSSSSSTSTLIASPTSIESTASASSPTFPNRAPSVPEQPALNANTNTNEPPTLSNSPLPPGSPIASPLTSATRSSASIAYSGLFISNAMGSPDEIADASARAGVRFSNVADAQNPDGTTFAEPTQPPAVATASPAVAAAPPPRGPPPTPPPVASPVPAPEPDSNRGAPSPAISSPAETIRVLSSPLQPQPRVEMLPPGTLGAQMAAQQNSGQPQFVILNGTGQAPANQQLVFPQQQGPFQAPMQQVSVPPVGQNQPWLWVNPPFVAPPAPPPPPQNGNMGAWCYPPNPSPFYVPQQQQQQAAPQYYVAEPAYVAEQAYIVVGAPQQQQQAPQVQYVAMNASTTPYFYYTS
ncbi:hypothetical protein M426DRAFT_94238 [Hypoxylon sp. CI-4A]|nr:hypothetical protein M426DRAFT_94238 [Hypoxylon sp. CI-4A]